MYNKGMFENNLAKLNNIRLKEELQNIPISSCTNDIAFVQTLGGQIVFLKGEIPTDDTTDPIAYAKSLITDEMKDFGSNDIIVCVGIGVGYILDELFSTTKAKIVIYEPDSKFLRFVFETVDLTQYLEDKRVFISDSAEECVYFILKNYLNDDKLEFVVSPILSIFYKNDFEKFSEILYSKLKSKIIDINTIKILAKKWAYNVVRFSNLSKKYYSIEDFRWKFTGKNALILGAGPSLKDNLENIKNNRDKFVIFAVNKTLETLEKNNIIPDFAVFADAKSVKKNYHLSEEFTSKLNIIADWKAETDIAEFKSNNFIVYFSDNELFLKKYARDLDIQLFPAEQTTTILSLICANYMDFEKIYFCGLDLAFKGDQPYCNDNTINIEDNTAIISKQKKHITEVMSITGEMIKTREDYSVFIKNLETIIKTRGLKNLYNITDFGALIEGMNYTTFENINIYGTKPDINAEIQKLPICKKDFKPYIEKEKAAIINIHDNIINRSPVNLVTKKIINDTTLLYECLQIELIELSRNAGQPKAIDEFYSKCILTIDNLLAVM